MIFQPSGPVSVSVSAQDVIVALGKAHTRSTPSLSSLPKVALETVPIFVWLNTDRSGPHRRTLGTMFSKIQIFISKSRPVDLQISPRTRSEKINATVNLTVIGKALLKDRLLFLREQLSVKSLCLEPVTVITHYRPRSHLAPDQCHPSHHMMHH